MKIFLTGASGYIGGTVANALIAAGHKVVGLAQPSRDPATLAARGIEPVTGTLDDVSLLTRLASEADAVINTANVDHRGCVEAMFAGLQGSNKPFIQTSGSGVIADAAGGAATDAIYEDETALKVLPARAPRAALNEFVLSATADGIRASVILPTMVYGVGTGLNPHSAQIPKMTAAARKHGKGKYVGEGANRWSNCHVEDLAALYLRVVERGPGGLSYYAENGENEMKEIAVAISVALGFGGRADGFTMAEAIAEYGEGFATLSLGSNSRVRATRAHGQLGWKREHPTLLETIARSAGT